MSQTRESVLQPGGQVLASRGRRRHQCGMPARCPLEKNGRDADFWRDVETWSTFPRAASTDRAVFTKHAKAPHHMFNGDLVLDYGGLVERAIPCRLKGGRVRLSRGGRISCSLRNIAPEVGMDRTGTLCSWVRVGADEQLFRIRRNTVIDAPCDAARNRSSSFGRRALRVESVFVTRAPFENGRRAPPGSPESRAACCPERVRSSLREPGHFAANDERRVRGSRVRRVSSITPARHYHPPHHLDARFITDGS